jgi:hypothetical protein
LFPTRLEHHLNGKLEFAKTLPLLAIEALPQSGTKVIK